MNENEPDEGETLQTEPSSAAHNRSNHTIG